MKDLNLNQKLSLIQKEFKANKSKFNSFGKYNFRSAEDILEALKPFNEKYQVSFVITEELIRGQQHILMPMIETTATIYDNNGVNEVKREMKPAAAWYKKPKLEDYEEAIVRQAEKMFTANDVKF